MEKKIAVVCRLDGETVRGTVFVGENNRLSDILNVSPQAQEFLSLTEVSIYDDRMRLVAREPFMALNKRRIVYVVEDHLAPQVRQLKELVSNELYDRALEMLLPLLERYEEEGELHYLAGVVYSALGERERAVEHFERAMERVLDKDFAKVIVSRADEVRGSSIQA